MPLAFGSAFGDNFVGGGMYRAEVALSNYSTVPQTQQPRPARAEAAYQGVHAARNANTTFLPTDPPAPVARMPGLEKEIKKSQKAFKKAKEEFFNAKMRLEECKASIPKTKEAAKKVGASSSSSTATVVLDSAGASDKGAISLLQEFVQCSREFRTPARRSILHWRFDERLADTVTLEFRATVAFLLDGIAHYAMGDWQTSKRLARVDAAERALELFVGQWGQQLLKQMHPEATTTSHSAGNAMGHPVYEVRVLEDFCSRLPIAGGTAPRWSISWEGELCKVTAELSLMDVPHVLQGPGMPSEEGAYAETAKRILWYLQCPGYEDHFEPDPDAPAVTENEMPAPPKNWSNDEPLEEDALQVERKTAVVRMQNRVQHAYCKILKPGQRVWEWTYDRESPHEDSCWRATVHILVTDKRFTSDWHPVQRDSQLDVCGQVAKFLDELEAKSGKNAC